MMTGISKKLLGVLTVASMLTVVGCSSEEETSAVPEVVETTEATSEEATFVATEVAPKFVENINAVERDDGLNINVEILWTGYNSQGSGSVIYVLVTNRNTVPLPADAIGQPTLTIGGEEIPPVEAGTVELDMPLRPDASVNLAYAFQTSYYNLSAATFSIGNLVFDGNLNNIS